MTTARAQPVLVGDTMDRPLLVSALIDYAARSHASTDVVAVDSAGRSTRSTWGQIGARARSVSAALAADGIVPGDRVATIAWNDHRHLEAYYGITGIGAVLHTVNPRLHDRQLEFILNDAADTVVLVDPSFVELAVRLAPNTPTVRRWVVLGRTDASAGLPGEIDYEEWIAAATGPAEWREFDERAAATLCYTSGTTGNPKGVLQSHRSIVLQTWACCTGDGHDVHSGQCVLGAVPMFHVNGWALPFAAAMSGAKLVLPGPDLSPEALVDLIEAEEVTFSAGVPTIWMGVVSYLQASGRTVSSLRKVAVGGSAAPRKLIDTLEDDYGVAVSHVWGMTEMTQGTSGRLTHRIERADRDTQRARQAAAGRELFGVELRAVGEDGAELPRDGRSIGEIQARGPWMCGAYYHGALTDAAALADSHTAPAEGGWLRTGDVGTLDGEGCLTLTDRTKDVIKSGGEWISSIDLENAAVEAPGVAAAAVIGLPHERWGERPLLIVELAPGAALDADSVLDAIRPRVASWWLPDDVVVIAEIPLTGTGKIDKKALRAAYADHTWPARCTV
ncbi:long-chain fatty acid--CoA ligase [Candidatus Poriferisodalis sp.]|uniref:long-chain fatty acid--CoA ligase n=1 Tax=Candidatus Poriferisodalis sp. TaxID=3101277 RepID=UPI003B0255C9